MRDSTLLFVYGTLRRGGGIASFGRVIGPDKIEGELYDLNAFPGFIQGEGKVVGELVEIPTEMLSLLDRYEGVEGGLYRRIRVMTESGQEAWVYELTGVPVQGLQKIESGDWFKRWESSPSGLEKTQD